MTHTAKKEAPPRVLVVDDEEMQRILARTSLEQAGFIVDEAADGAAAVLDGKPGSDGVVLMPRDDPGSRQTLLPALRAAERAHGADESGSP